jgi:hypothetical protein
LKARASSAIAPATRPASFGFHVAAIAIDAGKRGVYFAVRGLVRPLLFSVQPKTSSLPTGAAVWIGVDRGELF